MNALAWTLIHFVWEGGIIVAALALVLRFTRTASARYLISCGAMMLMLASAAATFAVLSGNRNATQPIASVHQTSVPAIASSPVAAELKQRGQLSDYLPWLVYLFRCAPGPGSWSPNDSNADSPRLCRQFGRSASIAWRNAWKSPGRCALANRQSPRCPRWSAGCGLWYWFPRVR